MRQIAITRFMAASGFIALLAATLLLADSPSPERPPRLVVTGVTKSAKQTFVTIKGVGVVGSGETFVVTNHAGVYVLRFIGIDTNGINCATVSFQKAERPVPEMRCVVLPVESKKAETRDPFSPVDPRQLRQTNKNDRVEPPVGGDRKPAPQP